MVRVGLEGVVGGVGKVVFKDDGEHLASVGVQAGPDGHHLAGHRGVDGGAQALAVADFLAHLHGVAHLDQRRAGRADMLHHGQHDLRRQRRGNGGTAPG